MRIYFRPQWRFPIYISVLILLSGAVLSACGTETELPAATDYPVLDLRDSANGGPFTDNWGDVWDSDTRSGSTVELATSICASLQGRLPTATEIYRNTSLLPNISVDPLRTIVTDASFQQLTVRPDTGEIGASDRADTTIGFRCIWPEGRSAERPITGFDKDNCYGDPGAECISIGLSKNVDTASRPPMDYAAAAQECNLTGAGIPTVAEWGKIIQKQLSRDFGMNHWASNAMYWNSNNHGVALVRWNADNFKNWGYQNDGRGLIAFPTNRFNFRCIGTADNSSTSLRSSPDCQNGCFLLKNATNQLVADNGDRPAADYATAFEACRQRGASLPNQKEFSQLVRKGWGNGSGNPLWMSDTIYRYPSHYGNALGMWVDTGAPTWTYRTGLGGMSFTSVSHNYRCVWRPRDGQMPACGPGQNLVKTGNGYMCQNSINGDSGGNANPSGLQVIDAWGNAWDLIERVSSTYTDAQQSCTDLGGRLPSASEVYGVRFGNPYGNPVGDGGDTSWLWTLIPGSNPGYMINVRVSDGSSIQNLDTSMQAYRCIWPSTKGNVLSGRLCFGSPDNACFSISNTVIADSEDRVALPMASAVAECSRSGGRVPDARDFTTLIYAGWENPTNNWLWINESMYWYSNNYGYAIGRWSGTGDNTWSYAGTSTGSLSVQGTPRNFRCVYSVYD